MLKASKDYVISSLCEWGGMDKHVLALIQKTSFSQRNCVIKSIVLNLMITQSTRGGTPIPNAKAISVHLFIFVKDYKTGERRVDDELR